MKFSNFFKSYLERIKQKDFSVIEETMDASVPLRVLLPKGKLITKHSLFVDGQRPYFESSDTSFDFEIISTEESENMGFGVCVANVKIPEVDSFNEFRNQVCFLFKKVEGEWILTFDQNTKLDSED